MLILTQNYLKNLITFNCFKKIFCYKTRHEKGRTPTHIRVQKESDWKTYYGSHSFIKESNKEDLERKILQLAFNKKELTYLECKWQFVLEVLETSKYLNDNILGKFFDKDFR